jgi:glycosyltransferase involved in cell wall biosynthesis
LKKQKKESTFDNLKGLFIVWGELQGSRRSEHIAQVFKVNIEYIHSSKKQGLIYSPYKYLRQGVATLSLLLKQKPDIVFIQNPPSFGPFFVYLYCLMYNKKFIIDTHTGALIYSQWKITLPMQRFLFRRALTNILTNDFLAKQVTSWGGSSFVLEDPPIILDLDRTFHLKKDKFNIVMVSVAYPDEPVREILQVARNLSDMDFYITGDFKKSKYFKDVFNNTPSNVYFTGFLTDDYFPLLKAADVIVCLTKDDHTFQSGANEALWMGKPLITSDWPILKEYFSKGTIHVDNSIDSIQKALVKMNNNFLDFKKDMISLQAERKLLWDEKAEKLANLIHNTQKNT